MADADEQEAIETAAAAKKLCQEIGAFIDEKDISVSVSITAAAFLFALMVKRVRMPEDYALHIIGEAFRDVRGDA